MYMNKISIFSFTQAEYAKAVQAHLGKGLLYAKKIYSQWFKKGKVEQELFEPQAQELVRSILAITDFFSAPLAAVQESGFTRKFLLCFFDGLESESVIIPMKFGHTLCISSQVGCRMNCAFCETGKMGLLRNLTVEEIVFQVFAAKFLCNAMVNNIVFMGMGEPFDNYEAVMQAVRVLSCEEGLSIALRRITISTSGRVEEIRRFAIEADPSLNLAVSLNAPNDAIRTKLMPVNKQWDLYALKEAMRDYCSHPKRQILIEYVLIEGINDSLEAAKEVADYLEGLPVKVNLIPYNSQRKGKWSSPSEEVVLQFKQKLQERGYHTLVRKTKGSQIMAACGQLGNREKRRRPSSSPISVMQENFD
jgi:23S rRNA (adenine2503-C2)-methyltransferase